MNTPLLTNKKILYVGPVYFHYDQALIKKIREYGAFIDTFELEINSPYLNFLRRFKKKEVDPFITNYYNKILEKRNFDYILVRQGFQIKPEIYEKLRTLNHDAIFINFHWDSIRTELAYNYEHLIKYFDKVYSFDFKDCENHQQVQYLPLFFVDEYKEFRKSTTNDKSEYDIMFIGAWRNKERLNLIKLTEEKAKMANLRFFHYLHMPLKFQYYYLKANRSLPQYAKYKSLSHTEILKLFSRSNTIIDFPSSFQTGLTMRTFETLGSGKKLITTNRNITKEPFYDPEFINIIDKDNFELDIEFIKNKPTHSIHEKIEDYSIEGYVKKLLQ